MWGRLSRINKKPIMAVLLSTILFLSVTAGAQLSQYNAADAETPDKISIEQDVRLSNMLSEPLLPSNISVVRSFEYPSLRFNGEIASTIVETIIWYTDGTMTVSDTRGYRISMGIPAAQGDVELLQNSTMVVQKVTGSELQYTVYWKPVKNSEGYVDKYKFIIEGTSVGDSTISFSLKSDQYLYAQGNRILTTRSIADTHRFSLQSATAEANYAQMERPAVNGLGFDWSDAVASGYQVEYDAASSTINISVANSFFIDPVILSVSTTVSSPEGWDSFEGEVRTVSISNNTERLYVFYYDRNLPTPSIVYKTSDDEGVTWSTNATSLNTGLLASDDFRWSVTATEYSNTTYVVVFYWISPAGDTNEYYAKRGTVNGINISWAAPTLLFTASNAQINLGQGAAVAATDDSGTMYAAFRWTPAGGTYHYKIMKSADGGSSWATSLDTVNTGEYSQITPMLAALNSTRMLFVYAKYTDGNLYYRVFDGSAWGTEQTLTGTGMVANTFKQLSSTSNDTLSAYVAYTNVTSSLGGILKIAKFSETGTFVAFETADSTLRHKLPVIMFNLNGDLNINSIVGTSPNAEIYNTRKVNGVWESAFNPYGTTPVGPDQLTAANVLGSENSAVWVETSSNNIMFEPLHHGTAARETSQQISPKLADWSEGQRRVVINSNGTMFSFYYDGSNIVYKKSYDLGHTWTGNPISTGTGVINSDNYRWSLAYSGQLVGNFRDRIALLYYQQSGSNTQFWQKTFKANDSGLVLVSTVNTNTVANVAACNSGVCAAAAGASDQNGNLFAAYKWKTATDWKFRILRSADGGSTWSVSQAAFSLVSNFAMTLTSLNGTKMLFVFNRDAQADLKYKVFDGSTWGAVNTVTAGISTGVAKQLSSATVNGTRQAYVAFLSGGNQGTLKVARFSGNGVFEAIETADSTLTHRLPSVSVTYDDVLRIHTLYNNIVYETKKNSSGWQAPIAPYGTTFESPDQLTTTTIGLRNTGALWMEGTVSPFKLTYATEYPAPSNSGIITCNYKVTTQSICAGYGIKQLTSAYFKTPFSSYFKKIASCGSNNNIKKCVSTNRRLTNYPNSFYAKSPITGDQVLFYFKQGVSQWCTKDYGCENARKFTTIQNSPVEKVLVPRFKNMYHIIELLYETSDGFSDQSLQIRMDLTSGYG